MYVSVDGESVQIALSLPELVGLYAGAEGTAAAMAVGFVAPDPRVAAVLTEFAGQVLTKVPLETLARLAVAGHEEHDPDSCGFAADPEGAYKDALEGLTGAKSFLLGDDA